MAQPRVCDFYNRPQGCRYGPKCHFLHELRDPSTPQSPFAPRASHNPRPDSTPDGVCRFHWSGGTCTRANCWFKHIRSVESSTSPTTADTWRPRPPTTPDAPGPSGAYSLLRPGAAKHQLSTIFMKPGFRFGLPSTINRFVVILASCSVANEWVFRLHSYFGYHFYSLSRLRKMQTSYFV